MRISRKMFGAAEPSQGTLMRHAIVSIIGGLAFIEILTMIGCPAGCSGNGGSGQLRGSTERRMRTEVQTLRGRRVKGASRGGPYVGIATDEVTHAIISEGAAIIPFLIAELDDADSDESVYVVYCLRKLHATEARQRVTRLEDEIRSGTRFGDEKRDLTLEMQIRYFLEETADTEKAERGS